MTTGSDSEWEYEYSLTETETFYVDLDISSVNNVIKSKNAGERKSLKLSSKFNRVGRSARQQPRDAEEQPDGVQDQEVNEGQEDEDEAGDDGRDSGVLNLQQPVGSHLSGGTDDGNLERLQILDLDTINPIISYAGNVYSCTWHDMLGTCMFITKHQDTPFHEPEISTEDFDLIGTSRIKLVGHRAKEIPRAGAQKRRREEDDQTVQSGVQTRELDEYVPEGRSLGTIKRTNPKVNIEIKRQANFLEQLMAVKKARGESDTVRTFVDRHTVSADAKQARLAEKSAKGKERAETESQRLRREIDELNLRVVKGDNEALERLQEIYADMEEAEDQEGEGPIERTDADGTNTAERSYQNEQLSESMQDKSASSDVPISPSKDGTASTTSRYPEQQQGIHRLSFHPQERT